MRTYGFVATPLATHRVNANRKDGDGNTPLLWAARNGHSSAVKLPCAEKNVDLNCARAGRYTPLAWATRNCLLEIVQFQLSVGDDVKPDSRNSDGRTLLSLAAESGHQAVVKLLLTTSGVDAISADSKDRTSLGWAAQGGNEAVTQGLLATTEKVCLDTPDSDSKTPFLCAARNWHKKLVQLFLATEVVKTGHQDHEAQSSNQGT